MNHASTSRANPVRSRTAGFTLIEVMVVVAIVAILAAVALPSYKDYIRRGRLPEAFNALSNYRTQMEQYYQDNRNYGTGATTACADSTAASTWNSFTPAGAQYFTYACAVNTATGDTTQQSYTITATGIGSANDHVYTIDQNGNRTTTKFKGAAVTAACWLTSTASC